MKRRAEAWELMGHLAEAKEQLGSPDGRTQEDALGVLRGAWLARLDQVPPVIRADLVAEAWTVLAEDALNRGSLPHSELALSMAEAAAIAGSGDPLVLAHLHLGWALYHRAKGETDEARACLGLLLTVAESIQDPQLLGEAELWSCLFFREQGAAQAAENAYRRAGQHLPAGERSKRLARLQSRLRPLAPTQPTPEPDPALEDTWEEPGPRDKK